MRFYVGNAGKGPSGSYGIRVRLNNTTVATFTHSLPAFSGTIVDLPFTVPYSVADGPHEIFIDLGPDGAVNELREGDNTTVSGLALRVAC